MTLKAARVNAGLTQGEAADAIGVHQDTISNWERGITFPNAAQIEKISKAYGVPWNDIRFTEKERD